jgi:enoyl-CoA hydratase/carnithine racemase
VKAVVIHGEGEHFSAGLDLSELRQHNVEEAIRHSRSWHSVFNKIEFGSVPVVAALHGAVVGGGLELAATAHVRIAERSTFYALPEGVRGIFVGGGGSVRIPRLIGASRMMEMMLTGHVLSAEEGQAIGLSHYLVDPGAALDKAIDLATKIAANAWLTNFGIIQALPRIAEQDPAAGYVMEALMAAIAGGGEEAKARVKAFLEKRAPKVSATPDR